MAGVLLAVGDYVGGAIALVVAIVFAAARYVVDRRGEDDTMAAHVMGPWAFGTLLPTIKSGRGARPMDAAATGRDLRIEVRC